MRFLKEITSNQLVKKNIGSLEQQSLFKGI